MTFFDKNSIANEINRLTFSNKSLKSAKETKRTIFAGCQVPQISQLVRMSFYCCSSPWKSVSHKETSTYWRNWTRVGDKNTECHEHQLQRRKSIEQATWQCRQLIVFEVSEPSVSQNWQRFILAINRVCAWTAQRIHVDVRVMAIATSNRNLIMPT